MAVTSRPFLSNPPSLIRVLIFQGLTTPVVASNAPIPMAVVVLSLVNDPPAMIEVLSGVAANALTEVSAAGAHAVNAPVAPLIAASRVRLEPWTLLKSPPR
jgi:hypothetical protein